MNNWFKVNVNEVLCTGLSNSELGIMIRYKALCEHFGVDNLTWQKIEFNFDCKERKIVSKLFGISPEVSPKFDQSLTEDEPKLVGSLTEVSPKFTRSSPEVCLKKGNRIKDLKNPYNIYNIYNNPIQDKTRQDKTIPPLSPPDDMEKKFEEFWQAYTPIRCDGRVVDKGSKKTAKEKYINLLKKGTNHNDIINGLEKYLKHCQANNQLTCGATVFLNQERWRNDYDNAIPAGNPKTDREDTGGEHQSSNSVVARYAQAAHNLGYI